MFNLKTILNFGVYYLLIIIFITYKQIFMKKNIIPL